MSYISVSDVRNAGGFPSDLATDSQIEHAISVVEGYAEKSLNAFFTPVRLIEFHDGTNKDFFYVDRNPVLRVDYVVSGESVVGLDNIFVSRESGKITLKSGSDLSVFFGRPKSVGVTYWSAYLIPSKTYSTVSGDVSVGSSVVVEVDSVGDLAEGDWVEIRNVDGTFTSAKIIGVSGSNLTLDRLVVSVDDGSTLTKLILPEFIKRFIELEAVIYLGINAIGSTYVFNTGYSLGDLNVQKGVPYTHWQSSVDKAVKERNTLRNVVKPRFKIL